MNLPELETFAESFMLPLHMILGLIGVVLCFFGLRLFKLFLVFIGGILGATLGGQIAHMFWAESASIFFGAMAIGALLGAVLSFSLYKLGLFFAGVVLALTAATPLVEAYPQWYTWLGVGICAGVLGWLTVKVTLIMLRLATAFVGGHLAVYGVGFAFGAPGIIHYSSEGGSERFYMVMQTTPMWAAIALGVALIGFLFQGRGQGKSGSDD